MSYPLHRNRLENAILATSASATVLYKHSLGCSLGPSSNTILNHSKTLGILPPFSTLAQLTTICGSKKLALLPRGIQGLASHGFRACRPPKPMIRIFQAKANNPRSPYGVPGRGKIIAILRPLIYRIMMEVILIYLQSNGQH